MENENHLNFENKAKKWKPILVASIHRIDNYSIIYAFI